MSQHLNAARDVLSLEIKGLEALRDSLDGEVDRMVSLLAATRGKIVATGMGKSGHVARKIAATLASTGAPAIFVHPGEASHGDLGIIAREDCVLALSKSGETPELGDLLSFARRFSVPVAAITAGRASTLAKAASARLILPEATEACDETRAPTTSTTMMMAAGDALAVALLRHRGFTATDFHGFHPRGNLGAALRRVRDLMHGPEALPIVIDSASVTDAVAAMTRGGFGCVGVVDAGGALEGIVTDGDLRRAFNRTSDSDPVSAIMTRAPKTVTPETLAGEALGLLARGKITALFVVEDSKPVGLLHVHDCLSTGVL
ncbi:MAG TPA: KpsF/GutQ family sugar-phosphate isomerase [Parvularcula sp.]|nr:KpsF/GutQ family sugar-phosphate isomerase [Parvularcula sp.]HBS32845.1 KpsF/GutQ family sugar-phosphate isomerase [Parvularcula sp.]HBS35541.1 KpsF/GutQ family sugar-phosphate isomerase [Parvularcula sp.]